MEAESSALRANVDSRRILVVDDNVDSAESLGMLLVASGHDVRTVHDGETALEVAVTFQPHVVFLDIGLPRMNGYELARELRRNQRAGGKMLLIALTGYGQKEDRQRSRESGLDQHLVKPLDPSALKALLASKG